MCITTDRERGKSQEKANSRVPEPESQSHDDESCGDHRLAAVWLYGGCEYRYSILVRGLVWFLALFLVLVPPRQESGARPNRRKVVVSVSCMA